MKRGIALSTAVALLVPVSVAAAVGIEVQAPCDPSLPQVLNAGLPYLDPLESGLPEGQADAVRELLGRALEPIYGQGSGCAGRPLHVNVTLGSDYQVVDWMTRGSIQMAVLSDLGVHVLQTEGVPLREVEVPDDISYPGLDPVGPELAAWRVGSGESERLGPGEAAVRFEAYRQALFDRARAAKEPPAVEARLVFRSHFSSLSFRAPVEAIHGWVEERLAALAGLSDEERKEIRDRFWGELFQHVCFRFAPRPRTGPSCRSTAGSGEWAGVEIEYLGSSAPAPSAPAVRDRLVITLAAAEEVFSKPVAEGLAKLPSGLPAELGPLFGGTAGDGAVAAVPAFESFQSRNAYFGTRTFAFTTDEVLQLLELNQRTSSRAQLALVLPGGGVKAAYQSRVLDDLYGSDRLVNYKHRRAPADGARPPLAVDYVVGTSGGALLGFFVARLGAGGPFDLSSLLWCRSWPDCGSAGGGAPRYLTSSQVFGVTDLPRYVSLVTILFVFCVGLALCSLGPRCWLAPEQLADRGTVRPKNWRRPLTLSIFLALLGTPLLVKFVTFDRAVEHVPELEGLLFAVLTVVAMFADQCLVYVEGTQRAERGGRVLEWTRWIGWSLLIVPFVAAAVVRLAQGRPEKAIELLEGSAITLWVYLALVLLVSAFAFLGLRAPGRVKRSEVAVWMLAVVLGSLAAGAVLSARWMLGVLEWLERVPLLFVALAVTLVLTVLDRLAGAYPRLGRWRDRVLPTQPLARHGLSVASGLFACFVLLDLTRPPAGAAAAGSLPELFFGVSKLEVPHGGLAVIVGAVLLLFAHVLRLRDRHGHYRLEGAREFADAVLAVLVGLSLAVYLALWALSRILPSWTTLFELTPGFWKWLVIVTAVLTAAVLLWSRLERRDVFSRWLTSVLTYLCGRHPNAHLVGRRFVRILALAVGGLVAWNFVLAPGLYGNRVASRYVTEVDGRFATAFEVRNGTESGNSYRLSTRLLATANALEQDGTRFVLAVPAGEDCPADRREPGSQWLRFQVVEGAEAGGDPEAGDREADGCLQLTTESRVEESCPGADGVWELDCLRRYVFASGSPFPVFPAHRVPQPDGSLVAMVDGGYSNLVPVEAARAVGVAQVLIVNSSNPFDDGDPGWWDRLRPLRGPLVDNVQRLPGFLYQRAQQSDRLSRQNLFVVSLSPSSRPGWPILTDFRPQVVESVLEAAEEDRGRRIGLVESWGPPSFQVSLQLPAGAAP